jgi:hypothetical protein
MISSHATWYAWMFLGLAFVVIFPDELLENIRLTFTWRHLIWLEGICLGIIVVAVIVLKQFYPEFRWFFPLIPVGVLALIRGILSRFRNSDED